ncbi:hypothetical protein EPN18_00265 [bacterium]|nr:MAG: hypothetical protein EPN18_00265 [bacterium]
MNNENKIKKEALQSFVSYAKAVQKTVRETKDGGSLIALGTFHPRHFLDILKKLEKSAEFIKLGAKFSNAYGGRSSHSAINKLQNYFRRSRLYLDIIHGNQIDFNDRFEELWSAFNEKTVKETTISPINAIDFKEELIDFDKFKIRKFSKDELYDLLDQEVCEAFYPHAVVDTTMLSWFWHITEERVKPNKKVNLAVIDMGFAWGDMFRVQREPSDRTLQLISLFDWGNASTHVPHEKKKEAFWFIPFTVAFKHTVSNDRIKLPNGSPDLAKLYLKTYLDSSDEEIEGPGSEVYLTDSNLSVFKDVVKIAQDFLEDIDLRKCKWEFLDLAMSSLAKAFLSDGIEQLLWNMVALEALIGEKYETTEKMLRRLGLIWGGREAKKIKEIHQEFNELYGLRSSLVHGSKFEVNGKKENDFSRDDLRLARDYARKTVLWFIYWLSYIHKELNKNSIPLNEYHKQKDLLLLLDYQIQSFKHNDTKINMPQNFPELVLPIIK